MENTDNPEILAAEISAIRHDSPEAFRQLLHYTAQLAVAVQVLMQTIRDTNATIGQIETRRGETPADTTTGGGYGVQPTCPYCSQSKFGSDRAAVYHCLCNNCGNRFYVNSITGVTTK